MADADFEQEQRQRAPGDKAQDIPIDRERVRLDGDFIGSKTDALGRITDANRIFIEFAGYSESELLGRQHDTVHHPDMLGGLFDLMWATL